MKKQTVTVGLIQLAMGGDAAANLNHAIDLISQAAKQGAEIVCLPELFNSRYFAQYKKSSVLPEPIPGRTTAALAKAAKENKVVLVGGSIYERAGKKLFNTSVVFGPNGKLLGKYRKTHVPQDKNYYEKNYFSPGDTGFKVFPTPVGKLGVLICYDQWFPEATRVDALMGAELMFYPTAIGTIAGVEQTEGDWQDAWENVMRGHAIANSVVVCAVNRVGTEDQMTFFGGSFVCDAFGKTLARGSAKEEIVIAKVDLQHGRDIKRGWRFFQNRRPETYGKLVE